MEVSFLENSTVLLAAVLSWHSGPLFLQAVSRKPLLLLRGTRGYNFLNIHLNSGPDTTNKIYL